MLSHTDKSERLAQRKQCEHCGEWLLTKSGKCCVDSFGIIN